MSLLTRVIRCRPHRIALTAAVLLALSLSSHTAFAQGGGGMGGGGGAGGGRMQALLQGISLTDAQQAKVDSIRASYQASMSSGDRQQMRESMRKQAADIRSILTPDQQTQFDQNLAAMRSRSRSQ
ncbi:MAG TPA: Spy/CpxP family protein refolding chaperone [Gemmatimonadaceae bacterium]|jgi:Spy/CpxP family protein refolding chaperone|nr:Spy/CpxP family protein refolding chaperone [Gemmatimonadaceae bacterium]